MPCEIYIWDMIKLKEGQSAAPYLCLLPLSNNNSGNCFVFLDVPSPLYFYATFNLFSGNLSPGFPLSIMHIVPVGENVYSSLLY